MNAKTDIRFDSQAILVTGAGRGIGRVLAGLLASRGAAVLIADNGTAMDGGNAGKGPAETAVAEIQAEGGKAAPCTEDIATEAGAARAVQAALDSFGRIDAIAHIASTAPTLTTADELVSRDLDLVVRVNALAGLWMTRAAWPHLRDQNYGRILFTTSAGIHGSFGNTHYAAGKSAYIGAIRCLALEGVEHNIRINGIAPAAKTRMTERFNPSAYADWFLETMTPESVAVGAAYLLSRDCAENGEIFALSGGRVARVVLAETEGVLGAGGSIEAVRDAMPQVMADQKYFYPKDLGERSVKVAELFGFKGESLFGGSGFAVAPVEKE